MYLNVPWWLQIIIFLFIDKFLVIGKVYSLLQGQTGEETELLRFYSSPSLSLILCEFPIVHPSLTQLPIPHICPLPLQLPPPKKKLKNKPRKQSIENIWLWKLQCGTVCPTAYPSVHTAVWRGSRRAAVWRIIYKLVLYRQTFH